MKERNFDEMIAYFNRRVSEMDIAQDYKMELLGMVTALGYKHEKTAQPELIRCKECIYWEQESICDGYCSEIEKGGFDEDHFCSYAERRADG